RKMRSLQLILQQGEDLVAVGRAVCDARGILHRDDARWVGLRHEYAILLRLVLVAALPEFQLVEPALLPGVEVGIGIAHEVEALGSGAMDLREAVAVDGQSHAARGSIDAVVDDEPARSVAAFFDP